MERTGPEKGIETISNDIFNSFMDNRETLGSCLSNLSYGELFQYYEYAKLYKSILSAIICARIDTDKIKFMLQSIHDKI